MPTGFYYHTEEFDPETFAEKCADRLEDLPATIDDVEVVNKTQADPSDFFDSKFTEGWKTANYGENIVEFDTPYSELNDESKQREIEHLRETKGQFFIVVLTIITEGSEYTCSALIEIRGRASEGKVEYFVQELIMGEPDL